MHYTFTKGYFMCLSSIFEQLFTCLSIVRQAICWTCSLLIKHKLIIPPQLVLVTMILLIGVSRMFIQQREADVYRPGTRWCRKRSNKGKTTVIVLGLKPNLLNVNVTIYPLPVLLKGSRGYKVMSGEDEAPSGQSHCPAGVRIKKKIKIKHESL